jgi:pentatricopeptide repeat protein
MYQSMQNVVWGGGSFVRNISRQRDRERESERNLKKTTLVNECECISSLVCTQVETSRLRVPGPYPEAAAAAAAAVPLCGLLLWYSNSSTVQTAPLTFSTLMKHLCRERLWRTAFYVHMKEWWRVDMAAQL